MTPPTYSIADLEQRLGVTRRAIRGWTRAGAFPAPEHHGPRTRYTHEQLVRGRVILQLRAQNVLLRDIKRRLAGLTPAQLEAMLPPTPTAAPTQVPPPPPEPTYPAGYWERIALMPGLELHVDTRGGAVLRQIAQAIWMHYGVGARPGS